MRFYLWIVKYRNPLVRGLVILNSLLALFWYFSLQATFDAKTFGRIGLVLYILTTIPGIMRRFGKYYKLVSILMIFRRHVGIMAFMFVLIHASAQLRGFIPTEFFQLFGFLSFLMLSSLFLTSNDWSVRKLGIWWDRIHDLTYFIVWLVFAHVALQRISVWTILIGITSVAQIASHIYAKRKLNK